jgi:hypothetical protein
MIIHVCSDIVTVHRKPSALGSSPSTDKQSVSQTVSPTVTAAAPLPMGMINLITLSIAEVLESTQRVSAFLTFWTCNFVSTTSSDAESIV